MTETTFYLIGENEKEEYFDMSREFYCSGAVGSNITDEGREKFFKEILSGELVKGYFIRHGNVTAGYAICALSASQEGCGRILWLDELFIKPEFRGKGLGRKFFEFLERGDGYDFIRLEVEPDNERALKLYRSLGYKQVNYLPLYKKIK